MKRTCAYLISLSVISFFIVRSARRRIDTIFDLYIEKISQVSIDVQNEMNRQEAMLNMRGIDLDATMTEYVSTLRKAGVKNDDLDVMFASSIRAQNSRFLDVVAPPDWADPLEGQL